MAHAHRPLANTNIGACERVVVDEVKAATTTHHILQEGNNMDRGIGLRIVVFCCMLAIGILVMSIALSRVNSPNATVTDAVAVTGVSTDRVTVEEVYRDTRVSVYRLVDSTNDMVCYWPYGGNMACQNTPR